MQIKKNIGTFTVVFNMLGFNKNIKKYEVIEDFFLSFENSMIIKRNIKPEELMKINQSGKSTIIIDDDPKPYDELRILVKLISNFLIYTDQVKDFTLELIEKETEDSIIIIYGSEIFLGDLRKITFSPSIRAKWRHPQLINSIIDLG